MLLLSVVLTMALQAVFMIPVAQAKTGDVFNILLLGIDTTDNTAGEASNADAVIIASLNLKTGAFKMANIQRDTLVELPDSLGTGRLCTVTSLGGPSMALKAVNSLFALDISYYVLVDMAGMEKVVDALGGLEVDIAANEQDFLLPDGKTKLVEKPGLQSLDTEQVMAYIKNPAASETTSRSERLGKILNACLKKSMNLDLNKMMDLVSELLNFVETNISLNDMLNFAFSALSVKLAGMEIAKFPVKSKLETRSQETVVVMEDWAEEILAIHTFLYGAISQSQTAQP
jgi:LCP family protein required for cell wall assembly